ncbi:sulfatase-like hydrolase/transferase [Ramlibacter sp. 2FC]|uniref:sulfatase-like hydrolase/transferase n=1 Tax=Ramlibacter sp. 2FC TaxID=2502188 RepID=UPI0010F5C9F2|nr:sulfatase-like hydrolase/transferase [Ramlibacter sp. 2FC]
MTASASTVRNVLFIMADQLRWDYLGCAGHPTLKTPNIDALAARGVRFANAFVQGPVCGASRMSTYTGRYVTSHGSAWNFVPLSVAQKTLGDHLRPHGVRCAVAGKTHVEADEEGAARLGMDVTRDPGRLVMEGGFEPYERDDGILPPGFKAEDNRYCDYLRAQGYGGDNPWHDYANSSLGADGELHSGWKLRWAREPARVEARHSETPYMTRRAMDFITEQGEQPWVLHLSYIKPHWPYVAPAPYHAMYGPEHVSPVQRDEGERADPHPVYRGFMDYTPSRTFSQDGVRETVIPAYMGLISQIDDQIGELMQFLKDSGRDQDTLIVFTSDHGDYLGDHWMGEKELFHDAIVKVPLLVVDPRASADATRGSVSEAMVEAIDLAPTFLDALGLPQPQEWLEGQSLQPLLQGQDGWTKDQAVCENSFAFRDCVRLPIGAPVDRCNMTMVRTKEWKYVHVDGLRPMLFDLVNDPLEYRDLGASPEHAAVREQMQRRLLDWLFCRRRTIGITPVGIETWNTRELKAGIDIGVW